MTFPSLIQAALAAPLCGAINRISGILPKLRDSHLKKDDRLDIYVEIQSISLLLESLVLQCQADHSYPPEPLDRVHRQLVVMTLDRQVRFCLDTAKFCEKQLRPDLALRARSHAAGLNDARSLVLGI